MNQKKILVLICLAILFGAITSFVFYLLSQPQELKSGRIVEMVADLKLKAGITEEIRVLVAVVEIDGVVVIGRKKDATETLYILLGPVPAYRWSDNALRATLAHEIGHVLSGHVLRIDEKEASADAWAICLTSQAGLREVLENLPSQPESKKARLQRAEIALGKILCFRAR